jgi:hypothetical protein
VDLTEEMLADLEIELFPGLSPYGLFRLCRAYVDKYYRVGPLNAWEILFSLKLVFNRLHKFQVTQHCCRKH